METLTMTRRTFLKATAVTGVAVALYSPEMGPLKGLVEAENAMAPETEEKLVLTSCRMCYGRCGLIAHIREGRVVKIEGNPEAPTNEGRLCSKGQAALQWIYHPGRLRYPMKRVGKRGEGKWERISWNEGLDIWANKLLEVKEKYGSWTILSSGGTGRDYGLSGAKGAWTTGFGILNSWGVGANCYVGVMRVDNEILGDEISWKGADINQTKCMLVWCTNPFRYPGYHGWRGLEAMEKGVKLIVVDPMFTSDFAPKADIWLPVRPGSDMALQLAFLNVIIGEGLYDRGFVKNWTNGPFLVRNDTGWLLRQSDIVEGGDPNKFIVWDTTTNGPKFWDATNMMWEGTDVEPALTGAYTVAGTECKPAFQLLSDRVKEWTPQKASEITWVSAEKIREAALMYAKNSPGACFFRGQKVEASTNCSGMTHAFDIMLAITGNIEIPGGNSLWPAVGHRPWFLFSLGRTLQVGVEKLPELRQYRLSPGKYELYTSPETVVTETLFTGKPYQIQAMFIWAGNPLSQHEDTRKVYEGLMKTPFIAAIDVYMSPSDELADIVFPAAGPFEVDRVVDPLGLWCILARQKISEPLWESKDDTDIVFEIAKRTGVDMGFKDYREFLDWQLEPLGITYEDFKKIGFISKPREFHRHERGLIRRDGKPGFQADAGKVNIYSETLKKYGWGPLPDYIEPPQSPYSTPDVFKDYPIILITGVRSHFVFHSEYHQLPWLRELMPYPLVEINPETAHELGIEDGDWVWIESPGDRIKMKAHYDNGIHPNVASCPHGWWFPEKPATDDLHGVFEANANLLSYDKGILDAAVGAYQNAAIACKIYKCDEPPKGVWFIDIEPPEEAVKGVSG